MTPNSSMKYPICSSCIFDMNILKNGEREIHLRSRELASYANSRLLLLIIWMLRPLSHPQPYAPRPWVPLELSVARPLRLPSERHPRREHIPIAVTRRRVATNLARAQQPLHTAVFERVVREHDEPKGGRVRGGRVRGGRMRVGLG